MWEGTKEEKGLLRGGASVALHRWLPLQFERKSTELWYKFSETPVS